MCGLAKAYKGKKQNNWAVQLDQRSGAVLAVNYRRSDIIESIHDGSFFSDNTQLYILLPAAIILFWLWISGMYLFSKALIVRRKHQQKLLSKTPAPEPIPGTLTENAI